MGAGANQGEVAGRVLGALLQGVGQVVGALARRGLVKTGEGAQQLFLQQVQFRAHFVGQVAAWKGWRLSGAMPGVEQVVLQELVGFDLVGKKGLDACRIQVVATAAWRALTSTWCSRALACTGCW